LFDQTELQMTTYAQSLLADFHIWKFHNTRGSRWCYILDQIPSFPLRYPNMDHLPAHTGNIHIFTALKAGSW